MSLNAGTDQQIVAPAYNGHYSAMKQGRLLVHATSGGITKVVSGKNGPQKVMCYMNPML